MSAGTDVATMDVLEVHVAPYGINVETVVDHARRDGIITDVEIVQRHNGALRRYRLAGSLHEFCVYAERLAARWRRN